MPCHNTSGMHQLLQGSRWPWLWQLDGRPMSGDIGAGTAQAAVVPLQRRRGQLPPGPLQSLAAPITTAGADWSGKDWRSGGWDCLWRQRAS